MKPASGTWESSGCTWVSVYEECSGSFSAMKHLGNGKPMGNACSLWYCEIPSNHVVPSLGSQMAVVVCPFDKSTCVKGIHSDAGMDSGVCWKMMSSPGTPARMIFAALTRLWMRPVLASRGCLLRGPRTAFECHFAVTPTNRALPVYKAISF